MKYTLRKDTTSRLILGVGIAVAVFLFTLTFLALHKPVNAVTGSGHLVTIHDRGEEKVLLSEAETIGDALKEAGITLDNHDAVEPAVAEKLVATEYQINIYRARPVTVIDGSTRTKIITAYQTAEQIVKDSGIALYPEDTTKLSRTNDILADGAGLQLSIDRATVFNFTLYGKQSEARTQATTVGGMLDEKGVKLGANDKVSVPVSTSLTAGIDVKVWREGKQTITIEELVAFETEQIRDADREIGYKQIQTLGTQGLRSATYEIEIKDGVEVGRVEIASIITTASSKQVEIIGVKSKVMPYTGGGTKSEWLAASNVPQESWGYADDLVQKESGWNPNSVNKSSGACGLAQALPCTKVPGNPYDPIDSLNWMNGYVNGRYGGWAQAYEFWQKSHWY